MPDKIKPYKFDEEAVVSHVEDIDFSKSYTYADYLRWEFDERLEIIKGKVFNMSPAPGSIHQTISGFVFYNLYKYLLDKSCKVFSAPFDVRLYRTSKADKQIKTVLQPDLCVICDPSKVDERGCIGAPDIVVEILSKGNNKKELQNKYEVYEESGVKEYWIIHPEEKTFMKYVLNENGEFIPSRLLTIGDEVETDILPGFTLPLDEVFKDR